MTKSWTVTTGAQFFSLTNNNTLIITTALPVLIAAMSIKISLSFDTILIYFPCTNSKQALFNAANSNTCYSSECFCYTGILLLVLGIKWSTPVYSMFFAIKLACFWFTLLVNNTEIFTNFQISDTCYLYNVITRDSVLAGDYFVVCNCFTPFPPFSPIGINSTDDSTTINFNHPVCFFI